MSKTYFSFADAARELEDACLTVDELDEIGPLMQALLEKRKETFAENIDRRLRYIDVLEANVELAKKHQADWTTQRRRAEKTLEELKQRTIAEMKANPGLHFIGHTGGLGTRKSKGVVISDQALLPVEFIRTKTEYVPAKDDIKKALDAGNTVPGAFLEERENLTTNKKVARDA